MSETLSQRIEADMKAAMRAKEKERLATIRLIRAAIKQREVDERIELDDTGVLAVLDKMLKQRRDSITQFEKAGRDDLVAQEQSEAEVIQGYMPSALDEAELTTLVDAAIAESGASSLKDMGQVMNILRPLVQGRADMGAVSAMVKGRIGG